MQENVSGTIKEARGFWERLRGLIGRPPPPPGCGLLFRRCSAIHTCFMSYPIDAVFLDRDGRAVKTVRGIKPWTPLVWGGRKASSVVEYAAGQAPAAPPPEPPAPPAPAATCVLAAAALAAAALAASAACADVMHVDFNHALTNGTGWVYLKGVSVINAGNASIKNKGEIHSPRFTGIAITNISLSAKFATASSNPDIHLEPFTALEGIIFEAQRVTANGRTIVSNFCWEAKDEIVGFTIRSETSNTGSLHLFSADIAYESSAPKNLSVARRFRDALRILWQSSKEALSTFLAVYRCEYRPASFTTLAEWDFSRLRSQYTSAHLVPDGFFDSYPGLSGENIRYPDRRKHDGNLQVGNTTDASCLRIDSVPEGVEELHLSAYVNKLSDGHLYQLLSIAGGETNEVTKIDLTEQRTFQRIPIAGLAPGSALLIKSTRTKGGPFLLTLLRLVRDYEPETTTKERVAYRNCAGDAGRCFLRIPGPGTYRIEAVSSLSDGSKSPVAALDVTVLDSDPPVPRSLSISIR